jgi:hypothetical protein
LLIANCTISRRDFVNVAPPPAWQIETDAVLLNFNDNWKSTLQTLITATAKAPPNDLESVIVFTLQPGSFNASRFVTI